MNHSTNYCRKLSEPDNEEKLEKLRQEIIFKLYKTGYVVTLEKVNTMLDVWLEWQTHQKQKYLFGDSCKNMIPFIVQLLAYCDEDFQEFIYVLANKHVENLLDL